MALSLPELKDLLAYGRDLGLQSLTVDGLAVVFGAPPSDKADEQPADQFESELPPELRHYSAKGRMAMGKR